MSNPHTFSTKLLTVLFAIMIGCSFSLVVGCSGGDGESAVKIPEKKKRRGIPEGHKRKANSISASGGGAPAKPTEPEESEDSMADSQPAPARASASTSTASSFEGGLPNGLFPQMSLSFNQNGFGGGLVPDFRNPSASDAPAPDRGRGGSIGVAGGGGQAAGGGQNDRGGANNRGRGRSIGPAGARGGNDNNQSDDLDLPDGMMGTAVTAFQDGRESDAFKYLYAHLLTDDAAAGKYGLQWYGGLAQPKVAMRIGVAIAYSPPSTFEGKPPVIGDPEDVKLPGANAGRSGSRGRRGGGSIGAAGGPAGGGSGSTDSPYAKVDTSKPEGFLMYYTGDFGDRMLNRIDSRRTHTESYYGSVLKEINEIIGDPDGERLARVSSSADASDPEADVSGSLGPGVMLLGRGKKAKMIERGKEMGLDVLMLFNVRVSSGRNPTGSASVKVFNLQSEESEEVYSSRSLKSDVVAKKRKSGIGEKSDPVEVALDGIFKEGFDTKFRSAEMPEQLKTKHVMTRLKRVLADDPSDPLAIAVEIVGYHRLELLDADTAMKGLDKLLGDGVGTIILTGSTDDRMEALADHLPGGDSDDGEFR